MRHLISFIFFAGLVGCGASKSSNSSDTGDSGTPASRVTWVVYTDSACTTEAPQNASVTVDTTAACSVTPDGSISQVVCFQDHITYENHPEVSDCSSGGVAITLPVGACQEFPGPHASWKRIDPATYTCLTSP